MIKVAGIFTHPIQYFVPLFRELSTRNDVEYHTIYLSNIGAEIYYDPGFQKKIKWDIDLLTGYTHEFVRNFGSPNLIPPFRFINPSIIKAFIINEYDVILVHGYDNLTDWIAFSVAYLTGVPYMLHGESNLLDPRSRVKLLVKRALLSPLIKNAGALLYIGSANRDFYLEYGAHEEKLFPCPYSVDNSFFARGDMERRKLGREFRASYKLGLDDIVFLFVGKFVHQKNPLLLLRAFGKLRCSSQCKLVMVGDGPLRKDIMDFKRRHNMSNVILTGFLNQTEIMKAYAAGDILVLPSIHEPWGLVVNEAMNLNTAIVTSDRVGCARDLVQDGRNGFVFRSGSEEGLYGRMKEICEDRIKLERYKEESRRIIENWGIKQAVDGIVKAAHYCTRKNAK